MKKTTLLLILTLFLGSGCSLFKFSINTGDNPLPKADLEMRSAGRGYFAEFKNEVVKAADSIAILSQDPSIKTRTIKWKLKVTSAAAAAVYQNVPEVGMINLWTLALQQQQMMQAMSDKELFGYYSPAVRKLCDSFTQRIEALTHQLAPANRFTLMKDFANSYAAKNPISNFDFIPNNLMIEWISYLGNNEAPYLTTIGLMSEVMSDMNDRVSGYTSQTADELSWGGELIRLQLQQDSMAQRLSAQVDSLSSTLRQMANTFDRSPEMFDAMSKSFSTEMSGVLSQLDYTLQHTFNKLTSEREALQKYTSAEREAILKQAEIAAQTTIQSTMDQLPILLGKILTYIISGILLLFSIPLWIGYALGKRARKKQTDLTI